MDFGYDTEEKQPEREYRAPENAPIEPDPAGSKKVHFFKIFLFLMVAAYLLFNFFKVPILTQLGEYLVVKDRLEKADLIVCLAGNNVERGLATIDLYRQGLAPYIFAAREELPDGFAVLTSKALHYPENRDLLAGLFREAGIPDAVLLPEPEIATSTFDEAKIVGERVKRKGYRSLIIVTSPTHTRRSRLTFENAVKGQKIKIMMWPSSYSKFNPQSWWKERKYTREVIIEYQKLVYYTFKYFF
ncbi:MAG: YdcF family protein [Desulfobacteraceae bacterium]|nr:MAG: YdcF family protein [Desulfobacteraceae bacterium]